MAKVRGARDWTHREASALVWELSGPLFELGWLLSVTGSVMKRGAGRDLDLVLTPTWTTACPGHWILGRLAKRWTVIERTYDTEHRAWQVVFRDELGRLIDVLVWRDRDRAEQRRAELDMAIAEGWGDGC